MNPGDKHVLTARVCAAFAIAVGAVTLLGWALGNPQMVRIGQDGTPMVVNTATGVVLAGAGLFCGSLRGRLSTGITLLLGLLCVVLGIEELCVLVFDISPAFSLPELHRPLQPDSPHPGRMAPNTAACMLLSGGALIALARSQREPILDWVRRAAIAVLAIGLLGVIGYLLRLEYLYSWTGVVRMAVHTGFVMIVLGIGLWNLALVRADVLPDSDGNEVAGVHRAATLLLVVASTSACIGGFAFLQGQVEEQMRGDLLHLTTDRTLMFDQVIEDRSHRAQVASEDDHLAAPLQALASAPEDPTALATLRTWALSQRASEFSSVSVEAGGRRWQLAGTPAQSAVAVALQGSQQRWLLWQDGYVLRIAVPVRAAASIGGVLVMEQSLRPLNVVSVATNRLGETGELGVCVATGITMQCFPNRSHPRPFSVPRIVSGKPLPMDYTFHGQTGTVVALDYRRHQVLAAYGPVGDTGIGLVVKRDIAEIYAPIRDQFQRIVLFLGALLLFGFWMLRLRLRPLLRALEHSRSKAMESSARFEAAVESNLDAFYILDCMRDASGAICDMRYVLMNGRGEEVLALPRAEVLGRGMCELFPILRTDGMLADCVRVVETGEPVVIERSAVILMTRWYHMQLVKLEDGVGLTVRDITVARQATEEIRHQALHDPLTGLCNRMGFELALAKAIADVPKHGQVTALALLDLDDFKRINDGLGHAAGDHVLQQVAMRLSEGLRPSDSVCRLGGDEFVLVLPNIDYPTGAQTVACKLIAQIAKPIVFDGHSLVVTVSIGIAAFPRDGHDTTTLIKSADHAMYRAKRAGRNGYALHDSALD
jgi:diguanylate cyclase (GGDEF)-like protein